MSQDQSTLENSAMLKSCIKCGDMYGRKANFENHLKKCILYPLVQKKNVLEAKRWNRIYHGPGFLAPSIILANDDA